MIYGSRDGWFPISQEEEQWYRDQWLGWSRTGMSLVHGPNYLLNNYVTPNITTWQSGELFRFANEHGLAGASFRSYTFSWAAHGPMAYMHHCLLWHPDRPVQQLREEDFRPSVRRPRRWKSISTIGSITPAPVRRCATSATTRAGRWRS